MVLAMDAALIGLAGGGGAVLVVANVLVDRRRARIPEPDPPPIPWSDLDEQTAAWVKYNLELAGVGEDTGSPDVEDLGLSNWDKPRNPALVARMTAPGYHPHPRDIDALCIDDWARVRPYLLQRMTDNAYARQLEFADPDLISEPEPLYAHHLDACECGSGPVTQTGHYQQPCQCPRCVHA